jgi:hypothetical protein
MNLYFGPGLPSRGAGRHVQFRACHRLEQDDGAVPGLAPGDCATCTMLGPRNEPLDVRPVTLYYSPTWLLMGCSKRAGGSKKPHKLLSTNSYTFSPRGDSLIVPEPTSFPPLFPG